jgi:hypothetical protein
MGQITSHRESAERYSALRLTGVIFTGLAALLLVAGGCLLAYCLYTLLPIWMGQPSRSEVVFAGRPVGIVPFDGSLGIAFAALWSFALLISGLQFLAMAGLIRLAVNLEENTRIAAQCLEQLRLREDPIERRAGLSFRS